MCQMGKIKRVIGLESDQTQTKVARTDGEESRMVVRACERQKRLDSDSSHREASFPWWLKVFFLPSLRSIEKKTTVQSQVSCGLMHPFSQR